MSNQTLIYILIALIISLVIAIIAFTSNARLKKSSYDNHKHQVLLDQIRDTFEKQIYILNDRMMKNEDRWRDVNHLLIRKEFLEDKPIILNKTVILNDFLKSNGITSQDLVIDRELIFILTPFNRNFLDEYNAVRNICLDAGFKCYRGDETFFQSDIFPEMLKLIVKANLIIANLNGKNSNVLYELGIAQALDKPVILIAKNPENLPIDIKSKRFLVYSNLTDLEKLLKEELIKLLKAQLSDKDKIINSRELLIGTWKNEWTIEGKTGSEIFSTTDENKYFINKDYRFNIENIEFNNNNELRFIKVGVKPNDNRRLQNILQIVSSQLLIGKEISGDKNYDIKYTKISDNPTS